MPFSSASNVSRDDIAPAGPMASKIHRQEPAVCPTDDDQVAPRRNSQEPSRKLAKQSPEYMWKSGVAGGLAGCAVRELSTPS